MKKTKFPLQHIVDEDTKRIWICCDSAITAMGITSLINKHYPGYTGHIASAEYFAELSQ
tara:strand:- start:406 stop:582 length:177 start_codon:yes stop_codon:yes gene_type:complete